MAMKVSAANKAHVFLDSKDRDGRRLLAVPK